MTITHNDARVDRDASMARVEASSGKEWQDEAYAAFRHFAQTHDEFLTEDARLYAQEHGLTIHDNRAWGPVTNRAVREGIIERVRYDASRTGHMRPMPVWKSLIRGAA